MGNETLSRRIGGTIASAALIVAVAIPLTAAGKPDKVTICHAGTDSFETLELPTQAVYGNGGHFEQHEGDYLGACVGDSTSTSEDTTTSTGDDGDETGPVEETTTTASYETPTTESDEDVPEVGSTGGTTSTTVGSDTSTSTAPGPEVVAVDDQGGPPDRDRVDVGNAAETVAGEEDAEAAALPYTGLDENLLVPAALLLLAGATAVFLSGGVLRVSGAHVAVDAERIGLGLHRGRHESA